MNILMLLANEYRPDPRVMKEATSLSKFHDVRILAWDKGCDKPGMETGDFTVERIRTIEARGVRGLKALLTSYPTFFLKSVWKTLTKEADIIHAHDFDTLLLGAIASKIKDVPLVYDAHEVYAYMVQSDVPARISGIFDWIERRIAKNVDHFITANEKVSEHVVSEDKESTVVMNCIPLPDRVNLCTPSTDQITVFYGGGLARGRLLPEYIEAIDGLESVSLRIAGSGSLAGHIRSESQQRANVEYLGYLDQESYFAEIADSDIILCVLDPTNENNRIGTPNKMFEAMAYGVPLIVTKGTYSGDIVEQYNCGVSVEATVAGIKRGLEGLKDSEVRRTKGRNGRRAAEELFNWGIMERRLLKLYSEIEE